jgi:hypothetical protein
VDTPHSPLTDALQSLNDAYVFKVNQAAEHDQWDLVQELTDAYFSDVQNLISASTPP